MRFACVDKMLKCLVAFFILISPFVYEVMSDRIEIDDSTQITIPLHLFNGTNLDDVTIELFFTLHSNTVTQISLVDIPDCVYFAVLQVHSYLEIVTLSYDKIAVHNNSVTSTNVGLLQKNNRNNNMTFYLRYNSSLYNADMMIAVQAYGINTPIPGGCNLEFQVEVSPFLKTTFTSAYTEVDFAPAAPPFCDVNLPLIDTCNLKPYHMVHKMYYQYIPEWDFTKETYFKALSSMLTLSRIKEHGVLAREKLTSLEARRIFATYPGTGRVFVVIAEYKNFSVPYVPSFTYGCNLKENNTYDLLSTTFSKVLCIIVLLLGLFVCFFGHHFYRIEVFLFGFFLTSISTYIFVWVFLEPTMALSVSVGFGFFAAGLILLTWGICQVLFVSLILATLSLGFVLASVVLYPLLDYVDFFVLDVNYWGVFTGITIGCPILMLSLPDQANAIACSVLGSYAAISSIDFYIGTNVRYIFLNTIRRATSEKFKTALVAQPFQGKDILLILGWCLLILCGTKMQKLLMRRKGNESASFECEPSSFEPRQRSDNERTPLLRHKPTEKLSFY